MPAEQPTPSEYITHHLTFFTHRVGTGEFWAFNLDSIIVGLILGYEAAHLLAPSVGNVLQTFGMTWAAVGFGIVLSAAFGTLAALIPAQRIVRLRVAEALRKI